MNFTVGLLLLGAFLLYAVLMFLERLSALLALPLMAATFVVLAAGADLFQPAQVVTTETIQATDPYGRRNSEIRREETPSRFALWKEALLAQSRALHGKARLFQWSVDRVRAELDDAETSSAALLATIREIREKEQAFDRAARAELDELPAFFAGPPHYGGQRAEFAEAFDALEVAIHFRPMVTILEEQPIAAARPLILALVDRNSRIAPERLEDHPPPPDPEEQGFRIRSGAGYLFHHVVLILKAGSLALAATIIATIFGGMFAVYVKNLNVAERMVYWTAEFAGERPRSICLVIFLVTGVIFTSVGGLGTVIMLGAIILPILRSVGMGPILSAGVFLIGMSMGGTLQPVARRLWLDFYGIPAARLDSILWIMVGLYFVSGVVWILWGTRHRALSNFQSEPVHEPRNRREEVPRRLMIAPLIPVVLVYFGRIDEITAFTISLVYMYVCTCNRRGALRVFTRSLIEGAQAVMPPVLLMLGIGILLTALFTAPVQGYLRPLLSLAVPDSRWGYMLTFGLAAPLALYRGPLNVWGMGLAVSATLLATSTLAPAAILGAILAAGMLQSVCDPTNTANVWIAGFQGVTVNQILRATIALMWAAAAVAVVIFGLRFV